MNYVEDSQKNKQKTELKVPVEVFSRVVGYFRPVYFGERAGSWNRGKTEEFSERKTIRKEIIEQFKNHSVQSLS